MMLLNIKKTGNELTAVIPPELAESLQITEGDTLVITQNAAGFEAAVCDPKIKQQIEAGRRCLREYRDTLIDLGQ